MANDTQKKLGRRQTLQILGMGSLGAASLVSLGGCSSGGGGEGGGEQASAGTGCNAPIEPQSQTLRTNLQYKEVSPEAEKNCSNCAQYIEGAHGDCGGCKLFSGPVQPKGYCLSWAPKQAAG